MRRSLPRLRRRDGALVEEQQELFGMQEPQATCAQWTGMSRSTASSTIGRLRRISNPRVAAALARPP